MLESYHREVQLVMLLFLHDKRYRFVREHHGVHKVSYSGVRSNYGESAAQLYSCISVESSPKDAMYHCTYYSI